MKKSILTLTLGFLITTAISQNVSVEKSTFGVQTGFLGIWVHNKSRLSNTIALRAELGLISLIFGNNIYDTTVLVSIPEPLLV